LSKKIAESKELQEFILQRHNTQSIPIFLEDYINDSESNTSKTPKQSIKYEYGNMYYAFHNVDIKNLRFDMFGNITGDLIDVTDFNKGDKGVAVETGRKMQEDGKLIPRFIIAHFVISRDNVIKLIKRGKNGE